MDGNAGTNARDFAGHTPGPWRVEAYGGKIEVWSHRVEGNVTHRECVAVVVGDAPADGRLLAAAPSLAAENAELREALREVSRAAYVLAVEVLQSDDYPKYAKDVDAAIEHDGNTRALLARLEGGR